MAPLQVMHSSDKIKTPSQKYPITIVQAQNINLESWNPTMRSAEGQ